MKDLYKDKPLSSAAPDLPPLVPVETWEPWKVRESLTVTFLHSQDSYCAGHFGYRFVWGFFACT